MTIDEEIKGRYRNDYHRGIINLNFTVNQLNYQFLQYLKMHKLTEPQYNILRVLRGYKEDGPFSIGFLKERMLDRNSDVSRIVDKLFEKGLVDRKENATDRRQKEVEITEKGQAIIEKMTDCDIKADTLLQNLNTEEIKELNRLLDKIRG
ncbi:MAG: MarR family transcriptional regulator [Bacteroidales bacterium]|nr:MarR family transcriptional regulator [Bacteroidales bacterium]